MATPIVLYISSDCSAALKGRYMKTWGSPLFIHNHQTLALKRRDHQSRTWRSFVIKM
jgi:hypothetical protein